MLSGERVRAWLLVKAWEPQHVQEALGPLLVRNTLLPDDDVVIRVDRVDCDFNLIIPVDVTSEGILRRVVGIVFNVNGVKTVTIARVIEHLPKPPVESHCYIAEDEVGGAYNKGPGRYPMSPGANPWG